MSDLLVVLVAKQSDCDQRGVKELDVLSKMINVPQKASSVIKKNHSKHGKQKTKQVP